MRVRDFLSLTEDVWHASPHRFDQFSMTNMGGGEGGQAFGWGLYFTDNRAVGDWYRAQFDRRFGRSHVYSVQIPDGSDYLLYEAPLSQQSAKVRKAFQAVYPTIAGKVVITERPHRDEWGDFEWQIQRGSVTVRRGRERSMAQAKDAAQAALQPSKAAFAQMDGEQLYHALCEGLCDKDGGYDPKHYRRAASLYLRGKGVAGIRYLNGQGSGHNYIIFDEKNAIITDVTGAASS